MSKSYIAQFREDNRDQLDKSFKSACKVRDDKKSTARDINEANKFIARVLNALQPDRTIIENKRGDSKVDELSENLLKRIHDEYTPKPTPRIDTATEDSVPKSSL